MFGQISVKFDQVSNFRVYYLRPNNKKVRMDAPWNVFKKSDYLKII